MLFRKGELEGDKTVGQLLDRCSIDDDDDCLDGDDSTLRTLLYSCSSMLAISCSSLNLRSLSLSSSIFILGTPSTPISVLSSSSSVIYEKYKIDDVF